MIPHDPEAEGHLLGAMLLTRDAVAAAVPIVTSADFFQASHGTLFDAIVAQWSNGEAHDPFTTARRLPEAQLEPLGGVPGLTAMLTQCPSTSSAARYAHIIASAATRRRIMHIASQVIEDAQDNADASEVLDQALAALGGIATPLSGPPSDLWTVDDFCDQPTEGRAPWVVPGLFRRPWRVVVVGAEGQGKSELFRAVALASAQGIHPFAFTAMTPVTTLLVDLENPADAIMERCNVLRRQSGWSARNYDPKRAWLWHRPGGIDLRGRADRSTLEAVLAHCQPDLVCIGPLYKAYRTSAKERDEQSAGEVQDVLDDLRTRYGFALLIEHHAPKPQDGRRDLVPYGSMRWLAWPEIGIKLCPKDPNCQVLELGRWRRDRVANSWPASIERGGTGWPWIGHWPDGFDEGAA